MAYEFVPQFTKMLNNLSKILDKAQAFSDQKNFESTNLLNSRLAPDQFNFTRQVQITCDTAKNFVSKLSGKDQPKFEDKETSIVELQQRIQKTVQYLATVKEADFKGWENQKVTNPRKEGKYLPATEFLMQHAVPNFYFHITTAYAILRHNGLDVGKMDYLGEIKYRDL